MNLGKSIADQIAAEIVSVQPMTSTAISDLMAVAFSEKKLIADGYKPVSQIGLLWTKDVE